MPEGKNWCVYILECTDHTLYTGITDDIERRLSLHNAGRGAKYTRGRGPLQLVYRESCASRSDALKREYVIKHMTRQQKLNLISKA